MFNLFNFLIYMITTAITPGPNNLMSMANSMKYGLKKSFNFNLGIGLGFSVVMLICTLLLNFLTPIIHKIKTPMIILGSIYLLYLAYETYRSDISKEVTLDGDTIDSDEIKTTKDNLLVRGLLLQFINPKIYIYCLISMEIYILPYFHENLLYLILFSQLLALTGFICTLLWALFGSLFRSLFIKHKKIVNSIMALLLIYCAISLYF